MMIDNVYILDNGAHTAKVGLSKSNSPRIIPNCIMKAKSERRRPFVGDQVEECRDASGLFYLLPFQKGFLVNWDVQKTVWDYIFSKECCYGNFAETPLIVTEPYFNFTSIQEAMSEIFFEEYECQSLLRINADCDVKKELQQLIDMLQVQDTQFKKQTIFGSASFTLRYLSHQFAFKKYYKTILWTLNYNPLLLHNLYSLREMSGACKKLWNVKACKVQDDNETWKLDLVVILHDIIFNRLKKHLEVTLAEPNSNDKPDGCECLSTSKPDELCGSNNVIDEFSASQLTQEQCTEVTKETHHCSVGIEQLTRVDYCDTECQPVNYSLKYIEKETLSVLDDIETVEAEVMLGYTETDMNELPDSTVKCGTRDTNHCNIDGNLYAETHSDQPVHYPLHYSKEEDIEKPKTYCTEGTPYNCSLATSLSDICSSFSVESDKAKTEGRSNSSTNSNCIMNQIEEEHKSQSMMLQTPLMFSRCSSFGSLNSVEPLDDISSVTSEYSRMTSGRVSPSELPDSPTQTLSRSLHSATLPISLKSSNSVFEEKVTLFREESTPVELLTSTCLSSLSFDDEHLTEGQNKGKFQNQNVSIAESTTTNGEEGEDISSSCISPGIQKNNSRSINETASSCSNQVKVSKLHFDQLSKLESKVLADCTKVFKTEDTPTNLSLSASNPELSNLLSPTLSDGSNNTDILAECIQAGMPKGCLRSRSNLKSSYEGSELPCQQLEHPSSSLNTSKTINNTIPNFRAGTTQKCYCNSVAESHSQPASCLLVSSENENTLLSIPPLEPDIDESKITLTHQSSMESMMGEWIEDEAALSDLLLLEQCITSGMPKKKSR